MCAGTVSQVVAVLGMAHLDGVAQLLCESSDPPAELEKGGIVAGGGVGGGGV